MSISGGHTCPKCGEQWYHSYCPQPDYATVDNCPSCGDSHEMKHPSDKWGYVDDEFNVWARKVRRKAGVIR